MEDLSPCPEVRSWLRFVLWAWRLREKGEGKEAKGEGIDMGNLCRGLPLFFIALKPEKTEKLGRQDPCFHALHGGLLPHAKNMSDRNVLRFI